MDGNTVKDMTTNFGKLDKFEGHDFRLWQKKMYFLLTTLKVLYVLTTPMSELLEDATVEAIRIRAKRENNDYICRGHILNGMSDSLFDIYRNVESAKELWDPLESKYKAEDSLSKKFLKDFKHTLKHGKDDLSLVQLGSHLRIEESLRAHDSDKGKGKETGHFKRDCRSGNKKNENAGGLGKGSKDHSQDQDSGATTHVCKDRCWFKTYESVEDGIVLYMGDDHFASVHGKGSVVLEFSSGKTITFFNVLYVPKLLKNLVYGPMLNKCGYKQVYESDKYILSKSGVFVGFGYYNNDMFMLNLNKVHNDSHSVYMSSSTIVNSSLWHARLGHVYYKRMLEMSKDDLIPVIDENPEKCTTYMLTKITRQPFKSITRKSVILELIHSDLCDFHATPTLGNKNYVITFINDASRFCYVYLLHAKDEALDKFRIYKIEIELKQNELIKTLRTDRCGDYYDPVFFQFVGIIHETTTPYTLQQNGMAKRKNKALKEMVNSMLSYLGLSEGFWGEAMLTACYLLNRFPNKRNKTTPYELWYKKRPNLSFLQVWGCRAIVRLPDPKRKTLGEKDIDSIFFGYAEHSKAYRFYLRDQEIKLDYNTLIAIVLRRILEPIMNLCNLEMLLSGKKQLMMRLVLLWKIIHVFLSDLPPGCKPLGCKWIFKSKMKVDGTIDKFKARLVIQGFRQKERNDYFDTYVLVARITTIRLLLALAAIRNLVIHQMDVKSTFLNGDLEEEVYMKQPEGFVMP
ncbi:zinc finger, CCHC-type containing protein, partial [Tanacetum coccineum]